MSGPGADRMTTLGNPTAWLGRPDSNLCILESEFAKTLSPGGGTRTCASRIKDARAALLTKVSGARSTPRSCSGGMKFSRSDFEMQRFESRSPSQPGMRKIPPFRGISTGGGAMMCALSAALLDALHSRANFRPSMTRGVSNFNYLIFLGSCSKSQASRSTVCDAGRRSIGSGVARSYRRLGKRATKRAQSS
jgi:hypothetical protein